jgi:hypothetical protein
MTFHAPPFSPTNGHAVGMCRFSHLLVLRPLDHTPILSCAISPRGSQKQGESGPLAEGSRRMWWECSHEEQRKVMEVG